MNHILKTERLYLREFLLDDARHLYELNSDPEVIQYTGDPPFKSLEKVQNFLAHYDAYSKTGIGRYAVIRKEDEAFLGWCGLKYHKKDRVVDIGYRFFKKYWDKGYATESSKGVIKYAFDSLKYPFLVAHAHINNAASQRVLDKLNMSFVKNIAYDNQPARLYKLENSHYELKEISAQDTWPVRHPVLRKDRPLKDVYMEADNMESTFHLGMYFKDKIIGVASFMEDSHKEFGELQSRLRGMAVLPEFRKKGVAELLLKKGEEILIDRGRKTLWFNARLVAHNFYSTLGYKTIGEEFEIPLVGPHYVMKKKLI